MNKKNLVEALSNQAGLTMKEAEKFVGLFFGEMSKAMGNGGRVEVRGFCSFFVKKYKAYTGRNPKTGKKVPVKTKKLPFFKCGKELKRRVNSTLEGSNPGQPDNYERRKGTDRRQRKRTVMAPERRNGKDRRNVR